MSKSQAIGTIGAVAGRSERAGGWQQWTPYAAVAWSIIYGMMGIYWAVSGRGFPYTPESLTDPLGPLVGRFGPGGAWIAVILAGIPAAAMGAAMLRGLRGRVLRPALIAAEVLLTGVLLLLMTSLSLLILFGYIPYIVRSLLIGAEIKPSYVEGLTQWATIHQLLCLIGGFLWLAATAVYIRRSGEACLYCGRRDGPEGWQGPQQAARWGRTAVYVSMVAPIFYAFTRYAWALGFPLGMTEEYLRQGQESGTWISGLFLASFGLVGGAITLGLVQRWGEVFPRWMIGLAGRRVPIGLAVVPAAIISVLLVVGGIGIWSDLGRMAAAVEASGAGSAEIAGEIIFQLGPTLLFPLWGIALAVAALGYYFRRRGPCKVCGRGGLAEPIQQRAERVVGMGETI